MTTSHFHHALPPIRISTLTHRGKEVWLVTFPFSRVLYQQCEKSGGHYSRTHRGWWWPKKEWSKEILLEKISYEKHSNKISKKKNSEPSVNSERSEQVKEKIREMEVWMRQKRYSESTINTYLSFMQPFFAVNSDLNGDGISIEVITNYNYQHFISSGKSYSSQNQWINAIKLYLKVLGLDRNDLQDIERPHKSRFLPDVLTQAEVKEIFHQTTNLEHRTLLMLIYSCGLRIGEALALKCRDIQSKEGLIYIRGGKGQKDRRVPLSSRILKELRQYYKIYKPKEYLFEGQKGGQYSNGIAAQVLKRAVIKTGIKKRVTLHTL